MVVSAVPFDMEPFELEPLPFDALDAGSGEAACEPPHAAAERPETTSAARRAGRRDMRGGYHWNTDELRSGIRPRVA